MERLEGETLQEFDDRLKKRKNQPRKQRIWKSWVMKDYYRWLRKSRWKYLNGQDIDEHTFHSITRDLFKEIAERLANGEFLTLGYSLGKIQIVKRKGFDKRKQGNSYGVDWKATIKLWYEDKEAMEKKQLVRIIEKEIFRITYVKDTGHPLRYHELPFMMLYPNRTLRLAISKNIKEGKLDAILKE